MDLIKWIIFRFFFSVVLLWGILLPACSRFQLLLFSVKENSPEHDEKFVLSSNDWPDNVMTRGHLEWSQKLHFSSQVRGAQEWQVISARRAEGWKEAEHWTVGNMVRKEIRKRERGVWVWHNHLSFGGGRGLFLAFRLLLQSSYLIH